MNYYKRDIRNVKGDTYSIGLTSDNEFDSIYFTCRDSLNDESTILFQKGLGDGISIVEETTEDEETIYKYAVRIAPEDTKEARSGTYYYDMQIALNSDVMTIMKGKFIIEQDATKQSAEPVDPELYIKVILDEINGEVIGVTVTDKTDYLNATKSLIKDSINYTGAALTDGDTFRSYASKLKDALINVINNGTDVIFNNLPHVTGEGTALTLEDTLNAKMKLDLKGNTSQTGTPTPSSPIPVNVVSGDNEINVSDGTETTTYNIDLPVENLFTTTYITDNRATIIDASTNNFSYDIAWVRNFVDNTNTLKIFKPNTTYTISCEFKIVSKPSTFGTNNSNMILALFDGSSSIIPIVQSDIKNTGTTNTWYSLTKTITTPSNMTNYYIISYNYKDGSNQNAGEFEIKELQIEYGTNANTYTPYGTTPIELNKIPNTNYEDRIFHAKDGDTYYDSLDSATKQTLIYDKWYLHKEVGKVVLDGTEDWSNPGSNRYHFGMYGYGAGFYKMFATCYANTDDWDTHLTTNNSIVLYENESWGYARLSINDNRFSNSLNDFKTWLGNNKPIVYYVLATPTNTEITYTPLINQLETLYNNVMSYEGITNINQVNNDLPFILNATALKGDEE